PTRASSCFRACHAARDHAVITHPQALVENVHSPLNEIDPVQDGSAASAGHWTRQFCGDLSESIQHLGLESTLDVFGFGNGKPRTFVDRMVITSGEPNASQAEHTRGQGLDVAGAVYVDHLLEPLP